MPAQTHSRVRNGFHILANSRGRLTNLNGPPCNTAAQCEKAYCCGPAIQPLSSKPRGCRRGLCSFTHNRGRKRALALGGVGSRSAATKRAISRRVENRNKMAPGYVPSATRPRNMKEWPTKNAICKTPCPCCLITMTKNHPRNACLGSCARKSNSPNSLLTATSAASSSASGPVAPVAPVAPVVPAPGASAIVALSAIGNTPGSNGNTNQYRNIIVTLSKAATVGTKIKLEADGNEKNEGEVEFTIKTRDDSANENFASPYIFDGNKILLAGGRTDAAITILAVLGRLLDSDNPVRQSPAAFNQLKVRIADSSDTYPPAATILTVTRVNGYQ